VRDAGAIGLAPEAFGAFVLATRPPPSLSYGAPREVALHPESDLLGSAVGGVSRRLRSHATVASGKVPEISENVGCSIEQPLSLTNRSAFAIDSLSRIRRKAEY
jgi:hypothetical protein